MFGLLKELLRAMVLHYRYITLEKCCYGATAYSVEVSLQQGLTEEQRLALAVQYLQKVLPGISHDDAMAHLFAMQARVIGAGVNPGAKVA